MDLKRLGKILLYPHTAVLILLTPTAIAFLVFSMVCLGSESLLAIVSYVFEAYTLTVLCFRLPRFIRFVRRFSRKNKILCRLREDDRFRISLSLCGALLGNIAYAAFHLGLGIYHKTFWFYSLAGYYFSLALMRFFLWRHTRKYKRGEHMRVELMRYRACGFVFLFMNLALSLIVFFMIYWNRAFHQNEITTITMAAYTFTAFTLVIINIVKYRKYQSPVYSASKAIGLAAASVSVLTLESTMLETFGGDMPSEIRRVFLALSGAVVASFLIIEAIYMIAVGTKKLKQMNDINEKSVNYGQQ